MAPGYGLRGREGLGACRLFKVAFRQEVDDVPAKTALVIEHIVTCALPSFQRAESMTP